MISTTLDRALVADESSSAMGVADRAASGQRVVDYGTLENLLPMNWGRRIMTYCFGSWRRRLAERTRTANFWWPMWC